MQWARWAVLVPVVWLLVAGCGGDPVTREVRELRLSGQPDSARTLALAALSEHADRRALWLEFARASLDICRLSADEGDSSIMETCVQAALLCAAVQQQRSSWGSGWRETGRLVSVQVARQLNGIVASYTTQMQTASMLKDLQQRYPGGAQEYGPIAQTEQQVQGYRDDARRLLTLSVIWRRLLELLPELNPGMSVMYGSELEQRQNQWIEELQLAPGYVGPLQQQARERVDAALARLQEDARDLGYFLVRSVTENGVLP